MEIDLLFDEKGLGGRKEKLGALFLPLTLIFFFHRPHSLPPSTSNQKKYTKGRATFFGAPDSFAEAYKMDRGEGSFGDFLFGSCGYFNKPRSKQKIDYDDLQLPLDGVAALADVNPDFPGSCGRCYEVRCSEGLLKSNRGDPIWLSEMYYMPQVNSKGKLEEDDGGEGKIEFGFFFFIIIIIIFSSFFLKKEEDSFHFFSSPSLSLSLLHSFLPQTTNLLSTPPQQSTQSTTPAAAPSRATPPRRTATSGSAAGTSRASSSRSSTTARRCSGRSTTRSRRCGARRTCTTSTCRTGRLRSWRTRSTGEFLFFF